MSKNVTTLSFEVHELVALKRTTVSHKVRMEVYEFLDKDIKRGAIGQTIVNATANGAFITNIKIVREGDSTKHLT